MLIDAHCHIATDFDPEGINNLVRKYKKDEESLKMILMSTNHIDYKYVDQLASQLDNITPCFGVHPWYAHLFTFNEGVVDKLDHYKKVFKEDEIDPDFFKILPDPMNFKEHLEFIKGLISKYDTVVIGEIGLDKLFRIPLSGFYGNPEFKGVEQIGLSKYKTSMDHQKQMFIEQLKLAVDLNLSISVHNVKTSGVLHDIISKELKDEYSGSVCLHSYTGSIETLELFIKTFQKRKSGFYISLSHFINNSAKRGEMESILSVVSDECVLTETDMTIDSGDPKEQLVLVRDNVVGIKKWDNDSIITTNYHRYLNI